MIYYLIYPISCVIGWLPYGAQKALSAVIRWFLYSVFGYRVKVVRENLANSFPEYSQAQRLDIERKFYVQLADVFVESMSLASVSKRKLEKKMLYPNRDEFEENTKGGSVIVMMAHYGSWEYSSCYAMHTRHEALFAVYRPLANKSFDKYFLKCRSRFGTMPVPMSEIVQETFKKRNSKDGVIVALIADQAPPRYDTLEWITFLNQPTQFFNGGEKLANKMGLPVYFTRIDKSTKGEYTTIFEMIYDGQEKVGEYEITRRYAQKLEEMIRRRPELWMWSHRRWKRKPLNEND